MNLTLRPLDRLGLQCDLFALVKNGSSSTADILMLLDAYRNEPNYTVWTSIGGSLGSIRNILYYTDLIEKFNTFGRHLCVNVAEKLGWEVKPNETHTDTLLRPAMISRMISYDDKKTTDEAKKR